jgi:hypothetical protein
MLTEQNAGYWFKLLYWHITASSSSWALFVIPSQLPFLLNLGGHKKAHITKLSKVCTNSRTILVNPKGGGTILDTLNLRVCHRNQSSKKNVLIHLVSRGIHFPTCWKKMRAWMNAAWYNEKQNCSFCLTCCSGMKEYEHKGWRSGP